MLINKSPEFNLVTQTTTGQPAGAFGVTVTPGNNTKGSWAQLIAGSSVTEDVYGIAIVLNSNGVSSSLRDTIVDVGIDPAGGSSYTIVIPDLLATDAPTLTLLPPIVYYFPLFIQAGSSIAVSASINNITVGSFRAYARLYQQPRNPEVTRVGSFVQSFGIVSGSSRGTLITAGTTSEGSWTQLGSATTDDLWYWKVGFGVGDGTLAGRVYALDLAYGDASNKIIIVEDLIVTANTGEMISWNNIEADAFKHVPSGSNIYGRIQASGSADTNISMAAYGMGG